MARFPLLPYALWLLTVRKELIREGWRNGNIFGDWRTGDRGSRAGRTTP